MKRVTTGWLTVSLIALTVGLVGAQATKPAAMPAPSSGFNSARAWDDLRQQVAIGPRPAGSAAIRETRAYITKQLSAAGLTVEEQPFQAQTPVGKVDMVNLIVRLPGPTPERILFTGHYDTKLEKDKTFVGASDGASSGAMLIELARALKDKPRQFTYEFVWFDGEEAFCEGWDDCGKPGSPDNTYGSRYYLQAAQKANAVSSIHAMILVDMIGAKDLRIEREEGYSAKWLNDAVWSAAKRLGFTNYFVDEKTTIEDDHTAWAAAGIPCIDIIDLNDYPQWHQASDDLDRVSAHSLQVVGDVIISALPAIEKHTGK